MNNTFEQYMAVIAGGNIAKNQEKQLSAAEKKQISESYFKMFCGLAFVNWIQGGTLGQAWFKALEQVKSFISAKNANNPAAMYMKQIFAAHNTRWSKLIMTSPNKDSQASVSPEQRAEWIARATRDTNAGLNSLNQILAQYRVAEPNMAQKPQPDQFLTAQQKMQMILQWQMHQNQRGGMAA